MHSLLTVQELRRSLCDHIVEKAENYVGFFAAQELPESFEEEITWIDLPNPKN
jgi:formiminotetrahydrofolate cyclodeaminase